MVVDSVHIYLRLFISIYVFSFHLLLFRFLFHFNFLSIIFRWFLFLISSFSISFCFFFPSFFLYGFSFFKKENYPSKDDLRTTTLISSRFVLPLLSNGMSNFMGYLIPKPLL